MADKGTSRPAKIILGAERRKLRQDLKQAKGDIRDFGHDAAKSIRSSLGTAFAGALSVASLGGGVEVARQVVGQERALARLAIQAGVSDEAARNLSSSMRRISDETGIAQDALIAGATQIVTLTGDFDLARASAQALAIAAQGTGASMEELAGVAAAAGTNFGIAGNKIGYVLDILATQGKAGSVELKDLSTLLPTASAQMAMFADKGERGVAVLGAALQITKRSTGTAAEAATAFNALGKAFVANAARIKKETGFDPFRVDPKTKRKTLKSIEAIIEGIGKSKAGQDPTRLIKMLGTEEAFKSFNALTTNWKDFQSLIAQGLAGGGAIEADFKRFVETPAGRIDAAWNRAANSLQRAVTPERVEMLADATEGFASALGFAVDHAGELVRLLAAIKMAQIALSTHRWATALSGVVAQAGGANTKLGAAAGALKGMDAGTGAVVSKLGRAVSSAAGLGAAFMGAYEATSLVVEALGLFEDKTRTFATADDPNQEASKRTRHREQAQAKVAELTAQRNRLASFEGSAGSPAFHERRRAQMADLDEKIATEQHFLEQARGAELAATIFERDKARGTEASDDVLAALQQQALIGQTGSTGVLQLPDDEVLRQFAPEAQNLPAAQLDTLIKLMEQQVAETARQRQLQERVASTRLGEGPLANSHASAPRTGTSPR
jgi:TP901 family phage tail tape measure protein